MDRKDVLYVKPIAAGENSYAVSIPSIRKLNHTMRLNTHEEQKKSAQHS